MVDHELIRTLYQLSKALGEPICVYCLRPMRGAARHEFVWENVTRWIDPNQYGLLHVAPPDIEYCRDLVACSTCDKELALFRCDVCGALTPGDQILDVDAPVGWVTRYCICCPACFRELDANGSLHGRRKLLRTPAVAGGLAS